MLAFAPDSLAKDFVLVIFWWFMISIVSVLAIIIISEVTRFIHIERSITKVIEEPEEYLNESK